MDYEEIWYMEVNIKNWGTNLILIYTGRNIIPNLYKTKVKVYHFSSKCVIVK
jgi:hypothetical protein